MVSSLFDVAEEERLFTSRQSDAFRRYQSDVFLQTLVERHFPIQHRISIITLTGSVPPMNRLSLGQRLYDMRFRFRAALNQLAHLNDQLIGETA